MWCEDCIAHCGDRMIDPKWGVWLARSVYNHVRTAVQAVDAAYDILLQEAPHPATQKYPKIEVRLDGPYFTGTVNDEWTLRVEINVLLTTTVGDKNLNEHGTLAGHIQRCLSKSLEIYKYGEVVESHLGTLNLGRVVATSLGRIKLDSPIQQSVVEVPGFIVLKGV